MTTDEKLQHFLDTCLEDANAQSQEMLSKYEAFAEEEFKSHKEKLEKDAAYMIKADEIYPDNGFRSNKGYGSAKHIAALKEKGATPIHRKSFIKNFVGDNK